MLLREGGQRMKKRAKISFFPLLSASQCWIAMCNGQFVLPHCLHHLWKGGTFQESGSCFCSVWKAINSTQLQISKEEYLVFLKIYNLWIWVDLSCLYSGDKSESNSQSHLPASFCFPLTWDKADVDAIEITAALKMGAANGTLILGSTVASVFWNIFTVLKSVRSCWTGVLLPWVRAPPLHDFWSRKISQPTLLVLRVSLL